MRTPSPMIGKLKASAPYWVTLGVAVYLFHVAAGISAPESGDQLGPAFWPKMVLILLMLVCAYAIGRIALLGPKTGEGIVEADDSITETQDAIGEEHKRYPLLLAAGIVLSIAYVELFDTLGFFLDTFAYLTLFILIGRYRRIGVTLATSAVGTLCFMFVFMKIVYVPLPIGTSPFSQVSLLLMSVMGIR